jgi:Holliday junction DNA helicase RuvA
VSSIIQGDLTALTNISGVGKKTAERIIMELKDKFKTLDMARIKPFSGAEISGDRRLDDALQALLSLGYSENVARKALQKLALTGDDTVQSLIKKSLGAMSS